MIMPQVPARSDVSAQGIPIIQWKFLSAAEKAAVDKSVETIRAERLKNVSLLISDEWGSYTGAIQLTQTSTSFIDLPERAHIPSRALWPEYTLMTPSRSYYVRAPLKSVEPSRGVWSFNDAEYDYSLALRHGMIDFHIFVGPYLGTFQDSNQEPPWAQHLNYTSLKGVLHEYVQRLVTRFKGRIQYYHLWAEANTNSGNANWPLSNIVDVIKVEAEAIRSIDPKARICIDLMNISPDLLPVFGRGSNWTTEFFVQQLLVAAVPFDVIGIETHYGEGDAWTEGNIATLYYRLITLSKFGKPIYVFEDGLESRIDPNSIKLDYWAPWHGEPTEAKQAEYMVAETLVYLGNPSVVGVRWYQLQDEPWDAPQHRYQGLLTYPNGSRKESFYALRNLWGNLTVHTTIQSMDGVVMFTGLAGNYTASVEGYLPIMFHVAEGLSAQSFNITLVSVKPQTVSTSTSIVTSSAASEENSSVTIMMKRLLATRVGNILLAALAMTIVIAALTVVGQRIKSLSRRRKERSVTMDK